MSIKSLMSFSTGELTPSLHDNVNLTKFQKGLETARNVIVSKTGSIMSRFSRAQFVKSKNDNEEIRLFSPPNSRVILEFGNLYVRNYSFDGTLNYDAVTTYTLADLPNMHFQATGDFVFIFVYGVNTQRLRFKNPGAVFDPPSVAFGIPAQPLSGTITASGAGYAVDYAFTSIVNGEESKVLVHTSGVPLIPVAAGQSNVIELILSNSIATLDIYNSIRIYRRPTGSGSYGLIGTSSDVYIDGADVKAKFTDFGGEADFSNTPPRSITTLKLDNVGVHTLNSKTGVIYQQRLLMANFPDYDFEAIIASRPGYRNNFQRDYPYDADSSLKFKSGTTGTAEVLRMVDSEGLIVFTTVGVYTSIGALSINNIALDKKGSWIIKEDVAPLIVPGGVFFIDAKTNTVRNLLYSRDSLTYVTVDLTIFSDHLFKQKEIISWSYQEGSVPLIVVCFNDGTFATLTYHQEHEMRAWTRHDSVYPIEEVVDTGVADSTFFVTNKNGNRHIEVSLPRLLPSDTYVDNPEADKLNLNFLMDAIKTTSTLVSDSLVDPDELVLVPVTPGAWDEPLVMTCGTSALFPDPGLGEVGTIFRHFNTSDRTTVDLEVISRADDDTVTVLPSCDFPSDQATGFRLYETFLTVTSGIDHLEGENVSVIVDGFVDNSPNNDIDDYDDIIVTTGSVTLTERAAICVIGRPVTADVGTLNINTVSQAPTAVESLTVNKLYIRLLESRGLYCSNKFPDDDKVNGMEDLDEYCIEDDDILGNRYKQPINKRVGRILRGEWDSNGKLAIRQVDPLHFEILSIMPDVEVLNRDNRS